MIRRQPVEEATVVESIVLSDYDLWTRPTNAGTQGCRAWMWEGEPYGHAHIEDTALGFGIHVEPPIL